MREEFLIGIVQNLYPGLSEVVLHPSLKNSAKFKERDEHHAALSENVLTLIEKNNICLTSYRKIIKEQ